MRPRHVSKKTLLMRRIKRKILKKQKSTDKFHLIFEGKISRNGTIDECINNALIVIASLRHSHYVYIVYCCSLCYANK